MVSHACNPNAWGAETGGFLWVQGQTVYKIRPCVKKQINPSGKKVHMNVNVRQSDSIDPRQRVGLWTGTKDLDEPLECHRRISYAQSKKQLTQGPPAQRPNKQSSSIQVPFSSYRTVTVTSSNMSWNWIIHILKSSHELLASLSFC